MRLYTMFRQKWEADLGTRRKERRSTLTKGKIMKLDAKIARETTETTLTTETRQSDQIIK